MRIRTSGCRWPALSFRGSPSDPGGARESAPPRPPGDTPRHAAPGRQHGRRRGGQRERVLRPPTRGWRAGPHPAQYTRSEAGHRVRRRARRRHGAHRGTGVVRRREACRRPEPPQAAPPVGRSNAWTAFRVSVHTGRAERYLGTCRPDRATGRGADPGGSGTSSGDPRLSASGPYARSASASSLAASFSSNSDGLIINSTQRVLSGRLRFIEP